MIARNILLTREWPYSLDAATLYCIPAAGKRTLRMNPISGEEEAQMAPGIAAGQQRVWCSALVLADELVERHKPALQRGARVLELGCGLGLPGMVCASLGAKTLLTDLPQAMPRIEESVDMNYEKGWKGAGSVRAVALDWDPLAAEILRLQEGRFDFVLCSDCVYESCYGETWRDIAECLEQLCDEDTVALISMQRRDDPGLDKFVERLRLDFQVEQLCSRKALSGMVEVYSARRRPPQALPAPEPASGASSEVLEAPEPAEAGDGGPVPPAVNGPAPAEAAPTPTPLPEASGGPRPSRRGGFSSRLS